MKRIFTKEEAQKLKDQDCVCLWEITNLSLKIYYSKNVIVWRIYGTRMDVDGYGTRLDHNLRWETYGTKWLLSTPNNSYTKRSNITEEDITRYLETGSIKLIKKGSD